MKKILSVLSVCWILFCICGCSLAEKQEEVKGALVCTIERDDVKITMTCDAVGDKITRITQESSIDISGYSEDNIVLIDSAIEKAAEQYKAIEGIEYSTEKGEGVIVEKIVIPIEEESLQTVIDAGMLPVEGEDIDGLSLGQTKESLAAAGWTVLQK